MECELGVDSVDDVFYSVALAVVVGVEESKEVEDEVSGDELFSG